MNKKRWITLGLLAALVFLVAGTASGSAGIPSIRWQVFSGGGAPAEGRSVGSNASFGQPFIGQAAGTGVDLSGGYWFEANNLVYRDGFESGPGPKWQCTTRSETAPEGQKFLGQFSNETACLVLEGLPHHRWVQVAFDFYAIRSWNGNQAQTTSLSPGIQPKEPDASVGPDQFKLLVDGAPALHTTFANWFENQQSFPAGYLQGNYPAQTGTAAVNTLGYDYYGTLMDATYRIVVFAPHSADRLQLDFTGLGLQAIDNESWGVDNIEVTLDPPFYRVFLPLTNH